MKLVGDWKEAPRWLSVQVLTILAATPFVWMTLPPDVKDMLPPEWRPWVLSILAIGGIIGRLKDQKNAKDNP